MTVERGTYTAAEVAVILGVSSSTVLRAVRRNEIPHLRLSDRCVVFPMKAFDHWMQLQQWQGLESQP